MATENNNQDGDAERTTSNDVLGQDDDDAYTKSETGSVQSLNKNDGASATK